MIHIGVLADPAHFHTRKWVKGLQGAGAEATVFSFFERPVEAFRTVHVPPAASWRGQITYASYVFSGGRLRDAARRAGIDVMNAIDITPYGVWGRRSGFRPLVGIAMGADILEYPPLGVPLPFPPGRDWAGDGKKSWLSGLRRAFFRSMVQDVLSGCALASGDNWQLVQALRDWFKMEAGRTMLNRWGVEPELFEPDPARQQVLRKRLGLHESLPLILFPRGLKPVYQGDVHLDACERLLSEPHPPAQLLLLSAGYSGPEAWRQRARDLAAAHPAFHFAEELLSREDMGQLWLMTDILVNTPVYDGYSNALSEGRYAGAVPIVNDIAAHREVLEYGLHAWLAEPFGPERLAEVLREVTASLAACRQRCAGANRQWVLENALLSAHSAAFVAACQQLIDRPCNG
jgi:hypothetical protein